jgi:hypothetical protein
MMVCEDGLGIKANPHDNMRLVARTRSTAFLQAHARVKK